jgi:hypothetical protein
MNILAITPSGPSAEQALREMLAPEFTLRIVTTSAASLFEDVRLNSDLFVNPRIRDTPWDQALAGIDAVFWCASGPVDSAEVAAIVEAIGSSRVARVVTLTSSAQRCWQAAFEAAFAEAAVSVRHVSFEMAATPQFNRSESNACEATGAIVDVVLRWLVRSDWDGIQRVQVAQPFASMAEMVN